MELYLIIAALSAALVCIVLLLSQNKQFRRVEELEKQLSQLETQLMESQKGDAALLARQDLLIQSVEGSLEKLQTHQTHNAMALVKKNAAVMVKDTEAEEKLMKVACALIENSDKTALMERNIAALAKRDAAMTIAEEVYRIIG